MADQVVRHHPNKRPSHPRLAPRWFGNPGTGAGADTAGCGCPAIMFPARTRAPIGFPVTGPNDTGAGFGCRDTGDDIGRALIATGRSPRLPFLAPPPLDAAAFCRLARTPASSVPGVRSSPVVVGRAQIVETRVRACACLFERDF